MRSHTKIKQQLRRIRILIFPMPFQGHTTPMLHLANDLHAKGFSITIIHTLFNSLDHTQFPNFSFHLLEDDIRSSQPNGLPDDPHELNSFIRSSCSEPFRKCLSRILNGSDNGETVACLIADVAWDFVGDVADSFGLNRIGFVCGSVLALPVFGSLPLLRQNGYFPIQESRLDEPVVEVPPFKVKDLPAEEHHDLISKFGKIAITYKQGTIWNAFEDLQPSLIAQLQKDSHPIPFFLTGPMNKYSPSKKTTEAREYIPWLNIQASNSVLYVSFGSLAKISKAEFDEIVWGLSNSNQPFLWVIRPDMLINNRDIDMFPQGFLEMIGGERGRIVKWTLQEEVLAHPAVGGFLTHCGWNSTLEAISHGVPMICHPFYGDQKVGARYVSDVWRIGLLLEDGLLREDIEKAIKEVMVGKKGEEMRERAADLMEKANLCIKEGGSSYMALEKLTNHILSMQKMPERTSRKRSSIELTLF